MSFKSLIGSFKKQCGRERQWLLSHVFFWFTFQPPCRGMEVVSGLPQALGYCCFEPLDSLRNPFSWKKRFFFLSFSSELLTMKKSNEPKQEQFLGCPGPTVDSLPAPHPARQCTWGSLGKGSQQPVLSSARPSGSDDRDGAAG